VHVCWDQWFPEAARLDGHERSRQILFYPTGMRLASRRKRTSTGAARQHASWETIQRSQCHRKRLLRGRGRNRVGLETPVGGGGLACQFWGQSVASAIPKGKSWPRRGRRKRRSFAWDIDLRRVEEQRTHWPFLREVAGTIPMADMTKGLID